MFKRIHKAVSSVSYLVLFDRFNLYGLQSLLILYLISCFGFLDKSSYLLYGTYVSLSFALTIVGGIIADRLLGTYLSAVVGASLCVMANIILFVPHLSSVYAGLALMIVGIGLLKPNNPNLLGMNV